MIWTTWEKIGVDRQACAWFIRKYVDQNATFCFVPRETVIEDKEHAFDTPTSKWTHKQGHSSFAMLVKAHCPKDEVLKRMAEVVDGADAASDILPPPEAYGLEAICIGIRAVSADDNQALEKGAIIFDALHEYLNRRQPNDRA